MSRYWFAVVALLGLFVSAAPVMAKDKANEGRGIVQSVDLTAKTFVLKTQGKTNQTLTLKYTDDTKFELDKAAAKAEDVLKADAKIRVKFDATNADTVVSVTAVTEKPKKEDDKQEGDKKN